MNLRLIFAVAAFLGVAACGDANAPANSARSTITPPKADATATSPPVEAAASADCPKAPEPKCPTVKTVKTAKAAPAPAARRSRPVKVADRGPHKAGHLARPTHKHAEKGLPPRPYRYDDLPRDRGDAPPRIGLDDGDRLARRAPHERSGGYREGRIYEDERHGGWRQGHSHGYGHGEAWRGERRRGDRYGAERPRDRDGYEHYARRSERRYAYEETETYAASRRVYSEDERIDGPCCRPYRPEAAGLDAHGFLTWPGKVPARP